MIFYNPSGAPELACEQCGCRWFDRIKNTCYECGSEVPAQSVAEFDEAVRAFSARNAAKTGSADAAGGSPQQDA